MSYNKITAVEQFVFDTNEERVDYFVIVRFADVVSIR